MANKDFYKILGVDRGASKSEIKIAFKKLARKYHPDVAHNKEEAEIKFREINEAYAVLSDDEKRSAYDRFGHAGLKGAGIGGGSPFGAGFEEFGFGDIFDMMFDMGGFSTRGRSRRRRSRAVRGRDVRHDVEIDLEQAFRGEEIDIQVETFQNCPVCNGRRVKPGAGFNTCHLCHGSGVIKNVQSTMFGQFISTTTCNRCNGEGQIPEEYCEECNGKGKTISRRKISVNIPAGVDSGNRIRIPEEGEDGEFGGPPGDLYVFIHVKEHEHIKRHGKDLYLDLPIGFADAALGTEKEIKTFDGIETIKIKEGTQSETIITLEGKGMPDLRGGKKGDFHVRVKVITPTKLTKKQRELLCKFAEEGPQFHCEKKSFLGKIIDAFKGK